MAAVLCSFPRSWPAALVASIACLLETGELAPRSAADRPGSTRRLARLPGGQACHRWPAGRGSQGMDRSGTWRADAHRARL